MLFRMDLTVEGNAKRSIFRWGSHWSYRPIGEMQPSRASISHSLAKDEMEEDQEVASPLLLPRHSMSKWAGIIHQAIADAASSSGSHAPRWEF